MAGTKADFGGYATKAGLECADGLTIKPDAFKHQDGTKVPLVYQHGHTDVANVLGHAILENRSDGVYAHCYFNGSDSATHAQKAVENGDLTQMSIYANRLAKKASAVYHGIIREVSLVMAGANPGALIDYVSVRHSDGEIETIEDEAIIYTDLPLQHDDGEPFVKKEDDEEPTEEAVAEDVPTDEESVEDIYNSLTDKQKEVVHQMLATVAEAATDEADAEDPEDSEEPKDSEDSEDPEDPDAEKPAKHDDITHTDTEGNNMTQNVFDKKADAKEGEGYVLSHDDMGTILKSAKNIGSFKEAVEDFALSHGIEQIDVLFPDAKSVSDTPEFIKRRTEWVTKVLGSTRHTPFSRIKSLSADLTLEDARAKGYIKGSLKKEEFFEVAKRVTTPQTIYKKQKLDRDDVLDITDFDVVTWIKGEMRIMLDEEIARAILIGDGRSNADDDKIIETNIRPVATDHELFQTTFYLNLGNADSSAEEIVDSLLLQRRHYRGSGNPDFYTTELTIAQIMNVKDTTGRRIYQNLADLATTLRVAEIVPVEAMVSQPDLIGIMVNLQDYTVGADKGGDVSMFDDFDIDYNAYKYLIETRCSGALTKPKSALVLRRSADNATLVTPVEPEWDADAHTITVPTTSGLVYKNQATGAALTNGTPVVVAPNEQFTVIAVPASSSFYVESTAVDEWTFDYEDGQINGAF